MKTTFKLFAFTVIASVVVLPTASFYGGVKSIIKKELDSYLWDVIISMDQNGGVVCQYLFNDLFITKDGYKFGNPDETISSVIGKNYLAVTLTSLGFKFKNKLDAKLGKDHCVNAIGV